MQSHQIQPLHSMRSKRRIGRGGKRGTYSGKGQKGQKSRAGAKIRSELKEAILKIPKRRGLKFKNNPKNIKTLVVGVSLSVVERLFRAGEMVTPKVLVSRGAVKLSAGRVPPIKILAGRNDLSKKLYFANLETSNKAKEIIEKAGGKVRA